ncbi:nitrilase-related carbon-nitrogen hydrolase [Ruicaihuangia caeni]|uniref:Nitrilase-related carbon-nitrogen hydrolase n=1 Tax=Ruicaihuangia caeni TaxID=3042517 RepID=A0AAW6TCA1_9MICO|nr:nitrilase-related carbon-nitrogen hydrolase [Klugiella sp. YN-L-19]MDI2099640.1 nitrilase-related carbon-nitrogen hydrolase [Klugiella sp. YN-L-19]
MKAAAVQLTVGHTREEAIDLAEELIREAAGQGASLVVLPELFAVPFVQPEPDPEYFVYAEGLEDGPSNSMVRRVSEELGITIVSSIFEGRSTPGVYGNTAATYVKGELKQVYRKSHLPFSNGFPEKYYFRPGDEAPSAVDTTVGRVGTIICYERHFPELGRAVALDGGIVLSVPVACASAPMKEVFQLELRAQAVANGFYVVCANRSGLEIVKDYFGTSAVYGPNGEVLDQIDDGAGIAIAEIDPELVARTRRTRPFLRDRRPDMYPSLVLDAAS